MRQKKIILARELAGALSFAPIYTLEDIRTAYTESADKSAESFDSMLSRAWELLHYIDGLTVVPETPLVCYRVVPLDAKSEFDAAVRCARYSTVLHNAAVLARDFPYDITGVDLVRAHDDFVNRMVAGGTADRPRPFSLNEGWEGRIALFEYDLAWHATAVARSLVFATSILSEYWSKVALQNTDLNMVSNGTVTTGSVSGLSHTVCVLGAALESTHRCVVTKGREFFAGNQDMRHRQQARTAWGDIMSSGLAQWLPCIDRKREFDLKIAINAEHRECKRLLARRRKKARRKDRKSLIYPKSEPIQKTKGLPPLPAVVLNGQGNSVTVNGNHKSTLTPQQYNVIQSLLEAGERGLNKDELVTKSGHSDARGILSRLAESDDDWRQVISMAGKTNGRYRIL